MKMRISEIGLLLIFSLSSQIETDTAAIRDALFARVISETGNSDIIAEIRGRCISGFGD